MLRDVKTVEVFADKNGLSMGYGIRILLIKNCVHV